MIEYPIDTLPFSIHKDLKQHSSFDKNGVILSRVQYRKDFVYHATAIASFAIANSDDDHFIPNIKWIINNMEKDGAIWHDFDIVSYDNVKAPWVGGLSQGLSISAMIMAYKKTNDKSYLDYAKLLFNGLQKHCVFIDDNKNKWICEYPSVPSILNGFIYSLYGVNDLLNQKIEIKSKEFLSGCMTTIHRNLHRYDLGNWSKYDLVYHYPATKFYNDIHVKQLIALYNITKDSYYLDYANRWSRSKIPIKYRIKICKDFLEEM